MGRRERIPVSRVRRLSQEPTDPLSVLTRTRERLADKSRWTQKFIAVDDRGYRVGVNTSHACRWSLLGAVLLEGLSDQESRQTCSALLKTLSGCLSLTDFNDRHTHDEVIEVLDEAITLLSVGEVVAV